jgi:hypothetical protein
VRPLRERSPEKCILWDRRGPPGEKACEDLKGPHPRIVGWVPGSSRGVPARTAGGCDQGARPWAAKVWRQVMLMSSLIDCSPPRVTYRLHRCGPLAPAPTGLQPFDPQRNILWDLPSRVGLQPGPIIVTMRAPMVWSSSCLICLQLWAMEWRTVITTRYDLMPWFGDSVRVVITRCRGCPLPTMRPCPPSAVQCSAAVGYDPQRNAFSGINPRGSGRPRAATPGQRARPGPLKKSDARPHPAGGAGRGGGSLPLRGE